MGTVFLGTRVRKYGNYRNQGISRPRRTTKGLHHDCLRRVFCHPRFKNYQRLQRAVRRYAK